MNKEGEEEDCHCPHVKEYNHWRNVAAVAVGGSSYHYTGDAVLKDTSVEECSRKSS